MELVSVGEKIPTLESLIYSKWTHQCRGVCCIQQTVQKWPFFQPLSLSKFNKIVQSRKGSVIPIVYQHKQSARKMLKTVQSTRNSYSQWQFKYEVSRVYMEENTFVLLPGLILLCTVLCPKDNIANTQRHKSKPHDLIRWSSCYLFFLLLHL